MSRKVTHLLAAAAAAAATFAATQLDKHPGLQNFVDREALVIRKLGFACGVERWPVKTLADQAAGRVSFGTFTATTVPKMRVLFNPGGDGSRTPPTETTVWRLNGVRVVAFKQEPDSDIHLKLQSVIDGSTMIAEVPDPSCVTQNSDAAVAAQQARIGTTRAALLQYLLGKGYTLSGSYQTVSFQATIVGVGFFDFQHGQNGVAPNGVELHPVLAFRGW